MVYIRLWNYLLLIILYKCVNIYWCAIVPIFIILLVWYIRKKCVYLMEFIRGKTNILNVRITVIHNTRWRHSDWITVKKKFRQTWRHTERSWRVVIVETNVVWNFGTFGIITQYQSLKWKYWYHDTSHHRSWPPRVLDPWSFW